MSHYDTAGYKLGNTVQSFGGNSEIRIEAGEQIRLGRDLVAGKLIEVRGGNSTHAATVADPRADEGIVIGGNVQIKTLQEQSQAMNVKAANRKAGLPAGLRRVDLAPLLYLQRSGDLAFQSQLLRSVWPTVRARYTASPPQGRAESSR
jgi:hypothetical protein